MTLNLKSEQGKEIATRLAQRSDIFVENFTPKLLDKLELGYDNLKKVNPRLVYCSISGYGKSSSNR